MTKININRNILTIKLFFIKIVLFEKYESILIVSTQLNLIYILNIWRNYLLTNEMKFKFYFFIL